MDFNLYGVNIRIFKWTEGIWWIQFLERHEQTLKSCSRKKQNKTKTKNRWSKLTIVGNKIYQKISNLLRKLKIFTTYIRRSTCPYGRRTWSGNDKNNAFQISLTTYLVARFTKLSLNLWFGWNYIFLMAHQSRHDLQLSVKSPWL